MSVKSKIAILEKKSLSQGQFALAAAAAHALADVANLDRQINLVGALHEVGYLQNSLSPYWREFRADEASWVERCLYRLLSADHDYWALAAMLGCNGTTAIQVALGMGFKSAGLRFYQRYDSEDLKTVDVGRARALHLEKEQWITGSPIENGRLSLSMQAKLPHGAWRSESTKFEMKAEWLLPNEP
jgi:hypothetical protein